MLEKEELRQRATHTGEWLQSAIRTLAASPHGSLIGDVRGVGLFLGVEFVRDRVTLEPAIAEVSYLCSRLKDVHQILTSIDGPHDNVLVMKPPMCAAASSSKQQQVVSSKKACVRPGGLMGDRDSDE